MTKLAENNPQGTANIADDRVLCTDFITGKSEICHIRKYKVRAETKYRIHDHYYFEALCESDAKAMFLDKMNKKESFFQYIEIKEV